MMLGADMMALPPAGLKSHCFLELVDERESGAKLYMQAFLFHLWAELGQAA